MINSKLLEKATKVKVEIKNQKRKKSDDSEIEKNSDRGSVNLLSIIASDLATLLHKQSMEHPCAVLMAKNLLLQVIMKIGESINSEEE